MNRRPRWTRELIWFLGDELIDEKYEYPMDGSADDLLDEIEAAVMAILCKHYGHEIENDQCGIPEHRYCVHCNRRETAINATDAELRQRDERIIQAAFNVTTPGGWFIYDSTYDAIIAAAEADRD